MEGVAGAAFSIYHGIVSEDSDGPVEWCQPVPAAEVGALAEQFPESSLRTKPAHEEAYVRLGPRSRTDNWQLIIEELRSWGTARGREPSELGARITYLAMPPVTDRQRPRLRLRRPVALSY
ncbi:MAG: hypothetical protein ABSD85_03530 [Acidimicrobiales bacterium]|jgi:hypothetical protein